MNGYIVIIVPEDKKGIANVNADKFDSGKTSKTFTVPLWDEKADIKINPPTYLWCCWWMSDEKAVRLKKDFDGDDKDKEGTKYKDKVFDLRNGWTAESILKKMKLKTYDALLMMF